MNDNKVYPFWVDSRRGFLLFSFRANDLQKTELGLIYAVTHKIPRHIKQMFKKPGYSWGKDVTIDREHFYSIRIEEAANDNPLMVPKSERYIRVEDDTHVHYDWSDGWLQIVQNDEYGPQAVTLGLPEIKLLTALFSQIIKDMEHRE